MPHTAEATVLPLQTFMTKKKARQRPKDRTRKEEEEKTICLVSANLSLAAAQKGIFLTQATWLRVVAAVVDSHPQGHLLCVNRKVVGKVTIWRAMA